MTLEKKVNKAIRQSGSLSALQEKLLSICQEAVDEAKEDLLKQITDHTCKRITEIVSDKRYNRGKPATVFSNAPLALMQMGWYAEADALKNLNEFVVSLKSPSPKESV